MLYPFKFAPIIKETIWGGSKLKYKSSIDSESIGESWEISSVTNDISIVSNGVLKGQNLKQLIGEYKEKIVGEKIFNKFGEDFPLLIKYIDANDDLSIQVHPNDDVAQKRHHSLGKTEMWYIVDAEPNAEIVMGFDKEYSMEEYLEAVKKDELHKLLNRFKVRKGESFFIPAGTIHAICKGCFIAEIQENSDITYRIFDYNRVDKQGNKRELHTDLAKDVINLRKSNLNTKNDKVTNIAKCEYFTTNIIEVKDVLEKDYSGIDSFVIYMCIDGRISISYGDNKDINVEKGETILIPATLNNIKITTQCKSIILETYID